MLNRGGLRKLGVFHSAGDASGFSGSLQLFFGDDEDRFGGLFLEVLLHFQSTKPVSYYHGFCFPETQDNKLARKFPF